MTIADNERTQVFRTFTEGWVIIKIFKLGSHYFSQNICRVFLGWNVTELTLYLMKMINYIMFYSMKLFLIFNNFQSTLNLNIILQARQWDLPQFSLTLYCMSLMYMALLSFCIQILLYRKHKWCWHIFYFNYGNKNNEILIIYPPSWILAKQFLVLMKHKCTLHFEHFTRSIPEHDGILHLPFCSIKGKWPIPSNLNSLGNAAAGPRVFFIWCIFSIYAPWSSLFLYHWFSSEQQTPADGLSKTS